MELCQCGTLEDHVLENTTDSTPLPLTKDWLRTGRRFSAEMIEAVHVLHLKSIVHRDLKPENMLLKQYGGDGEFHICLTDFGTAKRYSQTHELITQARGTERYAAPEVPRPGTGNRRYTEKCDVYSLGVTMNVMFRRAKTWTKASADYHASSKYFLDVKQEPEPYYPEELKTLILKMTQSKVDDRYDVTSAKKDMFFQKITCDVSDGSLSELAINWLSLKTDLCASLKSNAV